PVAVLHNDAAAHAARKVVVHFVTRRGAARLGALDAVPVNLVAGETLAVSADCTDACDGATAAAVTLTVGAWVVAHGIEPTAGPATYRCGTCRAGHGYGEAHGSISAAGLGSGAAVIAFAVCLRGAGIVGGGQ